MTTIQNNFDGGTNGAGGTGAITTGNSVNSGSALNTITLPTGGTFNYDATGARAGLGGRWQLASTSTGWRAYWQWTAAGTSLACRWMFCFNTLPSVTVVFAAVVNGSFAISCGAQFNPSGSTISLRNGAGSTLGSASSAISAGIVYGLEIQMDCGSSTTNGTILGQVYAISAPSTLLLNYSSGGATVNAGGSSASPQPIRGSLGENDVVANLDVTFDDIEFITGTLTPIGPPSTTTNATAGLPAATGVPPANTPSTTLNMTIQGA